MNKAFKFRLYPNKEQTVLIRKTFGCVRFIYNHMLEDRIAVYERYKDDKETLRKQKYTMPASYKEQYAWLKEVDSLALANAQLNLNAAYRNFFRNPSFGFPQFKSKHHSRKAYTTNNQKGTVRIIDNKTIRLPKLGDVKVKLHRRIPENANIKSATISETATGKFHISILVEYEEQIELIKPKAEKVLGLDYSSKELYVDSETNSPDYPKFYRQAEEKLKKAQRILSRREKGGENRKKQRLKVARLHEKVVNQRKDFLHKLSKQIANAYDAVAIEDLNMRGMAQGLHLAKSTNDNGFGMFKTFLAYKLAEQGKPLVVIDKWYPSSKTCHVCGEKNKELTISDREWICKKCNTVHNRDINAAINIKNEGCRMLGIT